MKLFEIKTPTLVRSCELIETAVEGLLDGSMETKLASLLIGGAGKLTQATGTEVKVRIAAPRIHGNEARQIEGDVVDSKGRGGTVRLAEPAAEAAE
jgi:hypothetical protein